MSSVPDGNALEEPLLTTRPGFDLAGNTFWEFKDSLQSQRLRRIVDYSSSAHYSDVFITPQWHQWLRHTRPVAPSLEEQRAEVQRQQNIKELARLADERWASKPSFLDKPSEQPRPATAVQDQGGYVQSPEEAGREEEVKNTVQGSEMEDKQETTKWARKQNQWDQHRGGPSEDWQPRAWNPNAPSSRTPSKSLL